MTATTHNFTHSKENMTLSCNRINWREPYIPPILQFLRICYLFTIIHFILLFFKIHGSFTILFVALNAALNISK